MKKQYFNAFGTDSILVEFDCKSCNEPIITENLAVPSQEKLVGLDEGDDIYVKISESIYCDSCGKQHNLEIWVTEGDAHVTILELKESSFIHILEKGNPPFFYPFLTEEEFEHYLAIESNKRFFETFISEIQNLKELLKVELNNPQLEKTFLKQIYIGGVTAMETFLSDTFVILTLENDDNLRRFVMFFPEYKKTSFNLSDIFEKYDSIKDVAKSSMLDIIFHNLAKVKLMYNRTFNIEFPPINEVAKCVAVRHDLVHRNGRTKTGTYHILKVDDVMNAIETIDTFVKEIALRLYNRGGRVDNRLLLEHNLDFRTSAVTTNTLFTASTSKIGNYNSEEDCDLPF